MAESLYFKPGNLLILNPGTPLWEQLPTTWKEAWNWKVTDKKTFVQLWEQVDTHPVTFWEILKEGEKCWCSEDLLEQYINKAETQQILCSHNS
jgi:hypothetical protein